MEATTNTNAQLLGLPEKSADFFAALAADAGNWSGYPWLSGNIAPGRSSSGMSQTLVRAGLIEVNEDDGDAYASFTPAGCAAALKLGYDLYDCYGYERPAAEVAETPAEPVAETPAPAGKSMTCPECGFAFKAPQARCNSRTACAKRAAARQGSIPGVAEIVARAEVRTAATRAATPVSTPAEIAEMRREDALIARAERERPVADWLTRNPADVLAEYVEELRRRAAADPTASHLAAQVAEQERQLAWVRARSSK